MRYLLSIYNTLLKHSCLVRIYIMDLVDEPTGCRGLLAATLFDDVVRLISRRYIQFISREEGLSNKWI